MPRLRTDDAPRKLRAVWLGPAGSTLPFQWTYVQWLVTLIAIPIGSLVGASLVRLVGGDWVWTVGIGVLWGGAGGLWLAVKLMRHVTFDEPLRYQRRLLRGEFSRRFSTPTDQRPVAVSFETPTISYLSPPVRRAIGWDITEQQPLDHAAEAAPNPYLTSVASPASPGVRQDIQPDDTGPHDTGPHDTGDIPPEAARSATPDPATSSPVNPYVTTDSTPPR